MLLTYSQAWVAPLIGGSVDAESSSLVRSLYFPAYAAGLLVIAMRPRDNLRGLVRRPFLLAAADRRRASVLWSVAPDQTLRREVALVFTTLGAVALAARWRWPALVEVVATAFAILAALSLAASALFPSIGRMPDTFVGSWRGLWGEKNTFGGMMDFAFLAFAAAGLLQRRRAGLLWWSLAGLAVAPDRAVAVQDLAAGADVRRRGPGLCAAGAARRRHRRASAAIYLAVVGAVILSVV